MPNLSNVSLRISAGNIKQFPHDPIPQVAFSGRSNVGKSSLINTLLGRKSLARVSGTPGKTITINFYDIDKVLFFVDLPGYGFAKRTAEEKKKWSALTDGYFTKNPDADRLRVVLQLVDSRIAPTADDEMMLSWLNGAGVPYIVVATKVDKLNKTDRKNNLEALRNHPLINPEAPIIAFSSLTGEGKEALMKEILSRTK